MDDLTKLLRHKKYMKGLESKNYTMQKLSEDTGIPVSLLNVIFYQKYVPPAKTLLRLAKALGIMPMEILCCAKKITPEMENTLFSRVVALRETYTLTYNIEGHEFPPDEELV